MSTPVSQLFDPIETQPVVEPPSSKDLSRLASQYLLLETEAERVGQQLADIKKRKDHAENNLLDAIEASGMKSFKLDTGHLITSCVKFRFSLPAKSMAEERERCMKWLKRVGAKDLMAEDINVQSMSRFLRERMEQGKEVIPEFKRFEQRYLSVRKEQ